MNLTCEQVKSLREAERLGELEHFKEIDDCGGIRTSQTFIEALVHLQFWHLCGKHNLIKKLHYKKALQDNELLYHLKETAGFSLMSDDKKIMKAARAAGVVPQECFYNAFLMAAKLAKSECEAKMVAGIATLPQMDMFGTIFESNFTHAVVQVDGFIYDFNFNLKLKASVYNKLFGFEPLCVVDAKECVSQLLRIKQVDKKRSDICEFKKSVYVALANADVMQRFYSYKARIENEKMLNN